MTTVDEVDRPLAVDHEPERVGNGLSFRTRLTFALIAAAVLPLASFGLALVAAERLLPNPEETIPRLLLLAVVLAGLLAVLVAFALSSDLTAPLREIATALERVSAGDLTTPIAIAGDDELARLAESHNRLARDLERRNRELDRILAAIVAASPGHGVRLLVQRAAADAREAFGMVDASILLEADGTAPFEERIPGEALPVRAEIRAGDERLGVLVGHLPATRTWERADQDLLELFANEIGVAVRNAELFARVDAQNARLVELADAKDDFLRGVSHNLQTPLTSIRAYANRLAAENPDRRLGIIVEQADRLSRMVRQLLTVSRLESGSLRPEQEIVALAARVQRAWEALGVDDVTFSLADGSRGWLAIADGDQLDQVLWALLDNAVKYGRRGPIRASIAVDAAAGRLRITITDHGPGIPDDERSSIFSRFSRGSATAGEAGSGLGLYVSRALVRAMSGDLVLEPDAEVAAPDAGAAVAGVGAAAKPGIRPGAAFTILLPAEAPIEG